jgi:hypothetical protein
MVSSRAIAASIALVVAVLNPVDMKAQTGTGPALSRISVPTVDTPELRLTSQQRQRLTEEFYRYTEMRRSIVGTNTSGRYTTATRTELARLAAQHELAISSILDATQYTRLQSMLRERRARVQAEFEEALRTAAGQPSRGAQ